MKKKELMKKLEQLINTADSLYRQLELTKKENEELKAEIENLKLKSCDKPKAVNPNFEGGFTVSTEEVAIVEEAPAEEKTEQADKTVVLSDDVMEYGSRIIGKIIVESARYAEQISASVTENKKELLNLIMGRAEVAKAEIYSAATSETSADAKKALIDAELSDATDYFKSVAGQI